MKFILIKHKYVGLLLMLVLLLSLAFGNRISSTAAIATDDEPALPYIIGDADGDGKVTQRDAIAISEHVARLRELKGTGLLAADVDGNGQVTVKDAAAIARYLMKMDTVKNEIGKWIPSPPKDYIPPVPARIATPISSSQGKPIEKGDTVQYAFNLKSETQIQVIQASIYYDPEFLEVIKVDTSTFADSAIQNSETAGEIRFYAVNLKNGFDFTETRPLVTVKFKVLKDGDANIDISVICLDDVDGKFYFDYGVAVEQVPGYFEFEPVVTNLAYYVLGDSDQDVKITVKDVTAIQRHIAKIISLDDTALKAADADQDGNVTIKDATVLQKHIAKINLKGKPGENIGKWINLE